MERIEDLSIYISCSNEPCTNQATFYHRQIVGDGLALTLYFCEDCATLYLKYTGDYDMEDLI